MTVPSVTGLKILAVTLGSLAVARGTGVIPASSPRATRPAITTLTVERSTLRSAIPSGFVGLSMEYRALEAYAGQDPNALNPVFEQLVRNLAPGQGPALRIGGDSTDWTWLPVAHVARPPGVKFDLDKRWLQVTHALAQVLDAHLILGVNLEANSRSVAAGEARGLLGGIGRDRVRAFEIGNEPELYGTFSWYRTPSGQHVKGRSAGYDFGAFTRDFSSIAAAMPRAVLAGPSSGSAKWLAELRRFLTVEPRVGLVTVHRYPLKRCSAAQHLTVGDLLSSTASRGLADGIAQYSTIAHARGVPLRVDEMNAISCGGQLGLSDSFAVALWSLDTLFEMARVGVDGVNIHTSPHSYNELVTYAHLAGGWQATVHPEYYGLMTFAQAAPAGSQLLRIAGLTNGPLRAWATHAPDGRVRVVLINKGTAHTQNVTVRVPSTVGPATLERLQAPSVTAKTGITLGGQGFGTRTATGVLAGTSTATGVTRVRGGYSVKVPAASAALLTIG